MLLKAEGLTAGTLQHELDHLQGMLFVDRIRDPQTLCSWASYEQFVAAGFAEEAARINTRYPQPLVVLRDH